MHHQVCCSVNIHRLHTYSTPVYLHLPFSEIFSGAGVHKFWAPDRLGEYVPKVAPYICKL